MSGPTEDQLDAIVLDIMLFGFAIWTKDKDNKIIQIPYTKAFLDYLNKNPPVR